MEKERMQMDHCWEAVATKKERMQMDLCWEALVTCGWTGCCCAIGLRLLCVVCFLFQFGGGGVEQAVVV